MGSIEHKKTAEVISSKGNESKIEELTLYSGSSFTFTVDSDGINPLIASISWTDRPGTATTTLNSSTPVLVNDLDIRVSKSGTTFYPFRLQSVTSTGTGDNIVDPFERINVNDASGTYTITISHKGSLVGGKQNYSLVVTGISNIEITGPRAVCEASNSVFTIQNPPSNFTWSTSSNLQIVSSTSTTVTVKAVSGSSPGFGTIYANYNNGDQIIQHATIIGEPDAYSINSNGNKNYSGGSFHFEQDYFAKGTFSVFSDTPNTTLNWSGPSNLNWYNLNNNTVEFDLNLEGNYLFTVTAENDCGSHPYFVVVKIGGIGPDPMFRVAPNPVETNIITIKDISSDSKDMNKFSDVVTLTLYDFNSRIVKSKTFIRDYSRKEYKLDVSSLKNQHYFLRIVSGEVNEIYKIILNKD